MNRSFTLIILVLLLWSCNNEPVSIDQSSCDGGTFVGSVTLITQQDVIDFGAMCYTKINGNLNIGSINPEFNANNNVSDLTPLSNLTEIYSESIGNGLGTLSIIESNILNNLNGLQNLIRIGTLRIQNCLLLNSLNGLEGLEVVNIDFPNATNQGIIIEGCPELVNLDGLQNLVRVGNNSYSELAGNTPSAIRINGNSTLQSLEGLNNLFEVHGDFRLYITTDFPVASVIGNPNLSDYCALQNLLSNGLYQGVFINGGQYNPTVQDIINGNCSQ